MTPGYMGFKSMGRKKLIDLKIINKMEKKYQSAQFKCPI